MFLPRVKFYLHNLAHRCHVDPLTMSLFYDNTFNEVSYTIKSDGHHRPLLVTNGKTR